MLKTILAGVAGGMTMNIVMLLTFRAIGFGWNGDGILLSSPIWPPGILPRTIRFAGLVFVMAFAFWEFFTPFNQFGEPVPLIALELLFWAAIAIAEAFVIAAVIERKAGSA